MVPVAVGPLPVLVEPEVVVADEIADATGAFVQDHVVEAVEFALGMEVHFAHGPGVVAGFCEFTGQGGRVFERVGPGHGEATVVPLVHAG